MSTFLLLHCEHSRNANSVRDCFRFLFAHILAYIEFCLHSFTPDVHEIFFGLCVHFLFVLALEIKHTLCCQQFEKCYNGNCVCVCVCADRVQRQEREVMLKLKEVVDRQRDELRAKVQQLTTVSKEVEAVRT